jgi:poly-gamma-glutamate synthesis protein (capsule biosynthesis protein)
MADTPELPLSSPIVDRRGRLQRTVRRQRETAARDSLIGAVVSAALVLGIHGGASLGIGPAPAHAGDEARITAAPPEDTVFSAAMVGDVMFGRFVERVAERRGHDALLAAVAPYLDGDYVSGNLEQVISEEQDLPDAQKVIHLSSGGRALESMVQAGFTTVSLANNHTMDHGLPGLRDTIAALDDAGLRHAGAGEHLDDAVRTDLQQHGDVVVATLSFTDVYVDGFRALSFQGGVLAAEPDVFAPLIQRARVDADLVIVHVHWGDEYDIGVNDRQREIAEMMSEAGADIIVGHHPHVLLPVEMIGDTLVFYSLGNFVFDQGWSRTRESAIARYHLRDDGTARVEFVPVYIREAAPRPLEGPLAGYRRSRIFERLRGGSLEWTTEGGMLVTEVDHVHVVGAER